MHRTYYDRQTPARREEIRRYAREYYYSNKESIGRKLKAKRGNETPEQRAERLQYMRDYHRSKRQEIQDNESGDREQSILPIDEV